MSRQREEIGSDQLPSSPLTSSSGPLPRSALFPLPLLVAPTSTHRSSGHRRHALRAALAVVTVANAIICALNTLYMNFPSALASEGMLSARPSTAQDRLLNNIRSAAAAHLSASRRCTPQTASLPSNGGDADAAAVLPGCTPASRPRAGASETTRSSLSSAIRATSATSLFVQSDSAYLPPPANILAASAAASREMRNGAIDSSHNNDFAHQLLLDAFDSVPLPADVSTPARSYSDALPTAIVPLVSAEVALPLDLNNVAVASLLPDSLATLYSSPSSLLLPEADARLHLDAAHLRKPRVMAERAEYVALVGRMMAVGMLSLTRSPRCATACSACQRATARLA